MRSFINHQIERYYKKLLRPWLFEMSTEDPEIAHEWVMQKLLSLQRHPWRLYVLRRLLTVPDHRLGQHLFGLWFPNPVGLAEGFDKGIVAARALATLGFGFIEGGSVTPFAQAGNPRPRIRRLPDEEGLLNRMGFNNPGAKKVRENLANLLPISVPLGISLGKGKDTPLGNAADDYCKVLRELYEVGDYIIVNISSPNTPGLRELQKQGYLPSLLTRVQAEAKGLASIQGLPHPKPVLVKVAPGVTNQELTQIVYTCLDCDIAGIVLTNTEMVEVDGLTWGKSGPHLFSGMLDKIKLVRTINSTWPIVAVGGINSSERAIEALRAGANLVKVYTGLVYEGPTLPWQINSAISKYMGRSRLCDMHTLRCS